MTLNHLPVGYCGLLVDDPAVKFIWLYEVIWPQLKSFS